MTKTEGTGMKAIRLGGCQADPYGANLRISGFVGSARRGGSSTNWAG